MNNQSTRVFITLLRVLQILTSFFRQNSNNSYLVIAEPLIGKMIATCFFN
uniref:Uncharacterized protein n=1 Tax=Rhizophagus irregularis (strain DAOM 181602 / DAOM 197198 / MUCL 43194) TaxID=747089 RepID=U9UWP6_RHIID